MPGAMQRGDTQLTTQNLPSTNVLKTPKNYSLFRDWQRIMWEAMELTDLKAEDTTTCPPPLEQDSCQPKEKSKYDWATVLVDGRHVS